MKLKDIIGSMTSKFAALVLTFGLAGGAWAASPVVTFQLRDEVGDMTIQYDSSVYTIHTQDGVQRSGAAVYNYMTQTVANGDPATEPTGEPSYWYHSGKTFPVGNNTGIPFTVEQSQAYVFDGWRLSGENVRYDFSTPVTSDITLVPHFSAVEAVFEIYTEADLFAFAREVALGRSYRSKVGGAPRQTVKLMNNITLTSNWTPIPGNFHGIFDGNGYAISGLVINDTTNETGFFRTSGKSGNGFVVTDLTFQNPSVTSSGSYVGVLVGQADCVTVTNVTVNNPTILCTSTGNVGGLVGSVNNNVSDNSASASVFSGCSVNGGMISCTGSDGRIVGGLIGQGLRYLTVTNCSVSNVTINGYRRLGGLIGLANGAHLTCTDASVSGVTLNALGTTSYASGDLTMGGLVGQFATPKESTFTGTVSDITMTGPESIASGKNYVMGWVSGGTGGTVAAAETTMTGANMTFDVAVGGTNTRTIETATNYAGINGVQTVATVTIGGVTTPYADLHAALEAGKAAGSVVTLLADVDLSGVNWVPVSDFAGTFDGNNKTISNLTINDNTLNEAGLFGVTGYGSTFKDLTLDSPTVNGRIGVGTLAGKLWACSVINCHVTGDITVTGYQCVGGLAGSDSYTVITDCSVIGDDKSTSVITGNRDPDIEDGDNIGGLVGMNGPSDPAAQKADQATSNCSVGNLTLRGWRKVGGLSGQSYNRESVYDCSVGDIDIICLADTTFATAKEETLAFGGMVGIFAVVPNDTQYRHAENSYLEGTVSNVTITCANDAVNAYAKMGIISGGQRGSTSFVEPTDTQFNVTVSGTNSTSGTKVSDNTDKIYSAYKPPVAQIGANKYETLAAAIAAVPTDGTETTITMIANEAIDIAGNALAIAASKNVVLDLNGFQVVGFCSTGENSALILNNGTLTIVDSSDVNADGTGAGKLAYSASPAWNWSGVDGDYSGSYASNLILNNGTVSVESGLLEVINPAGTVFSASFAIDSAPGGVVSINGGKLTSACCTVIRVIVNNSTQSALNIDGGSVVAVSPAHRAIWVQDSNRNGNSTVTISGGLVSGQQYSIQNDSYGSNAKATITGGTFDGFFFTYSELDISGGTFNGGNRNGTVFSVSAYGSKSHISGGVFYGFADFYSTASSLDWSVTGGAFSYGGPYQYASYTSEAFVRGGIYDDEQRYIAPGFVSTGNTDPDTKGSYPYAVVPAVASITIDDETTYYATFEDAIDDAKLSDTIVVINYNADTMAAPNGWEFVTENDVTTLVKKEVAQNVQTSEKYFTLAAAIAAAQDGQTVKLLADVDLGADGLVIESGKNFTLDIGEFNITGAVNGKLITNNGTLVVNGTTGCVYNTDVSAQGHDAILNNGTMTINGGWFGDSDNDKTNANPYNRGAGFRNFGTAVINGGHFTDVDNNWQPITVYAYAIISSGENAVLTVNNADVYGKCNGALALISGAATIVDGTFSVDGEYSHYAIYNPGCNATVQGGTFTKVESSASQYLLYASGNGTTTISGGTFASPKTDFISVSGGTASVSISGGIFSETPASYCAVGYTAVENTDETTNKAYPYMVAHVNTGYIVEKDNGEGYAVIPSVDSDWIKENVKPAGATTAEIEDALNTKDETTQLKKWQAYVLNQTESIKADKIDGNILSTNLETPKDSALTGLAVTYSLVSVDGESETDGTASGDKSFALEKADDGSLETGLYKVRVHFKPTGDTSASEVTVDSVNTVGVLKTTPASSLVVVPVPFKALGGNGEINVSDYIKSGLANGDTLHVYNGDKYDTWTYNGSSWDKTTNVTKTDENTESTSESAEPSVATLSRGTAAILRRAAGNTDPLVFVGDYTGAAEQQIAEGWNLVASPSIEAFDPATKFTSGKIQIPTGGIPKNYTYSAKTGKWGYSVFVTDGNGKVTGTKRVEDPIPAGTGFWYVSDEAKKVEW